MKEQLEHIKEIFAKFRLFINYIVDYILIAFRFSWEKLTPIGTVVSSLIAIFGVLKNPDDYRDYLLHILYGALIIFVVFLFYQFLKLMSRCVDFPLQDRPARHFYILNGGFDENMRYVLTDGIFKNDNYTFAMGIDKTLELKNSTNKGILKSVTQLLLKENGNNVADLQNMINKEKDRLLECKKQHSLPESIEFGDIIDISIDNKITKITTAKNKDTNPIEAENDQAKKQEIPMIRLLLIVNSVHMDPACSNPEEFENVVGIDSRIIIIKLFEYCRKKKIQNLMLGAMGTNGLNFPYHIIVREIVNAYCYWFGQLAIDSASPLNVILSLRMIDISRHAGELPKIVSSIQWMINRRKETNKKITG